MPASVHPLLQAPASFAGAEYCQASCQFLMMVCVSNRITKKLCRNYVTPMGFNSLIPFFFYHNATPTGLFIQLSHFTFIISCAESVSWRIEAYILHSFFLLLSFAIGHYWLLTSLHFYELSRLCAQKYLHPFFWANYFP